MAFHQFPGWEHGPEDATHFSVQDVLTPWLKMEGDDLYFARGFPVEGWAWVKYLAYEHDIQRQLLGALAKPPAIEPLGIEVINGVEVNWQEAPEGTTHAVVIHKRFRGWRKLVQNNVHQWKADRWAPLGHNPQEWIRINEGIVFEHPYFRDAKPQDQVVKQAQPEQPNPAPKKQAPRQVGWW